MSGQETRDCEDGCMGMTTNARAAIALTLVLFGGCDRDDIDHDGEGDQEFPLRVAEAYCEALFACDPLNTCRELALPYATQAECLAHEREQLEQVRTAARDAGLSYDATCVDATIDRYAQMGCRGYGELRTVDRSVFTSCQPYYGTIPEGENPCFEVVGSALSECDRGLLCSESGGSCISGLDDSCQCEDGFACNPDAYASETCFPVLAIGAECPFEDDPQLSTVCAPDAYCDLTFQEEMTTPLQTCQPRVPNGGTCGGNDECSSHYCDQTGTCRPDTPLLCGGDVAPSYWR